MLSSALPTTLAILRPSDRRFSSLTVLTGGDRLHFPLSRTNPPAVLRCPPIRMGGGPRTFPGGVSKWQWKRMQAKKAKQLLKARLLRERQIYEMRKRTELRAAVTELERPWEVVERGPTLFSVAADDQLKALADRFQRPGGFDMWSERDGPQLFRAPQDGLPSARFFPKGAVHSVKPYGVDAPEGGDEDLRFDDWIARGGGGTKRRSKRFSKRDGRDVIDVEANESTEGSGDYVEEANHSGSRINGEEHGKFRGRGRNGQLGNDRMKAGRVSLRPTTNLHTGEMKAGRASLRPGKDLYAGEMKAGRGSIRPTTDMYAREAKAGRHSMRPATDLYTEEMKPRSSSLRPTRDLYTGEMKPRSSSLRPTRDLYNGQMKARSGSLEPTRNSYTGETKAGRGSLQPTRNLYTAEMKERSGSPRPTRNLYTAEMKERSGSPRPTRNLYTGQTKAGRGSLHQTTDMYTEDSGYRRRDLKRGGGNGSRRGNMRK